MKYKFNFVGNKHNLERLSFYFDAFKHTSIMPNLLIQGCKGIGKSLISKEIGRNLYLLDKSKKKVFIEIIANGIKNADELMSKVLLQYDRATIFVDEAHALNRAVTTFLLPLLSPNKNNFNEINYNGGVFRMDFKKITWIFATSEPHLIFKPLADRLTQIELIDYTQPELAEIIARNVKPEYTVEPDTLLELASYGRGNGRSAFRLACDGINSYLDGKNKKHFAKNDLNSLVNILDLFPLGLSRYEAKLLHLLSKVDSSSLNALCSKTGMSKSALQQVEFQLMKNSLMEVAGNRRITMQGIRYVKEVEARLLA